MKIFARVVFVLALLCGLAYGSFAFGKYVLSNKLFGDGTGGALRTVSRSTTQASAVTRHTNWKGNKPRVEVRMLPADEAGPAPQTSALADEDNLSTERRTDDEVSTARSTASRTKIKERNLDDAPIEYSLGDDDGRSRRRHRKSKDKEKPKPTATPVPADAATISTPGAADGAPSADKPSNDAELSISSAPPAGETRSRPAPTPSTPRRARARRARETAKPRIESPIPRPENAGAAGKSGGDSAQISPIPQPE